MTDVAAVRAWVEEERRGAALRVRRIPLAQCRAWALRGGEIRHDTGRYFQVVGTTVPDAPAAPWARPLLRQTEVGLLAFLVRGAPGGFEWLLQAKTEPGNVGETQVAPTVQATRSNYERVHGGSPTRYLEWFLGDRSGDGRRVADTLASEQGSRFLHKRNRNVAVVLDRADAPPDGGAWRWTPTPALRAALSVDYLVNTDGRSVIVGTPWTLLADGGRPFERWGGRSDFLGALARSYAPGADVGHVLDRLAARRDVARPATVEVPLGELPGWRLTADGLAAEGGDCSSITCVDVTLRGREVESWCQPAMAVTDVIICELWCQERDGVLRFLFRLVAEPGLVNGVELGPTVQSDRPDAPPPPPTTRKVHLAVTQSDEGGRFLWSSCRYAVVEVGADEAMEDGPDDVWLTLAEIEALAAVDGTLTNEARSVVSLLLAHA